MNLILSPRIRAGYTLFHILIIIAVVGALAALALPIFQAAPPLAPLH